MDGILGVCAVGSGRVWDREVPSTSLKRFHLQISEMPDEVGGKESGEREIKQPWDTMKLGYFCDIQIKRSCR